MAEIVDLRGRQPIAVASPVLADPSGRRARMLARTGRIVAGLFCLWLAGLVLAGLGILPDGAVPLGSQIGTSSPPSIGGAVKIVAPTRADLVAAKPAITLASTTAGSGLNGAAAKRSSGVAGGAGGNAGGAGSRHHGSGGTATGTGRGGHTGGSGGTSTPTGGGSSGGGTTSATGTGSTVGSGTTGVGSTVHGKTTAPGQVVKTTNPGHVKTTAPGGSGSAPGQLKQTTTTPTTTTPGNSGSSPGHTTPHGSGSGHSN
jgi:hypothetical protein